jgi:hypothetical protein
MKNFFSMSFNQLLIESGMTLKEATCSALSHDRHEKYEHMLEAWLTLGGDPEEFPKFDYSKDPMEYVKVICLPSTQEKEQDSQSHGN